MMDALFYQPLIGQSVHHLTAEESRHCVRVLRKRKGDTLMITDGKGSFYSATVDQDDQTRCSFKIISKSLIPKPDYSIHLAVSPTKNSDRIEWMIEKCVEIGVDDISLVICDKTERMKVNMERLQKLALSAMKQSQRAWLPSIHDPVALNLFVKSIYPQSMRFIAYVDSGNPNHLLHQAKPNQPYVVLVGPEGDFTRDELLLVEEMSFKKVSLGKYRLRTETAALTACQILNLVNS
jgi:16S rRNA (uracil1498-N3)-methyltransferase